MHTRRACWPIDVWVHGQVNIDTDQMTSANEEEHKNVIRLRALRVSLAARCLDAARACQLELVGIETWPVEKLQNSNIYWSTCCPCMRANRMEFATFVFSTFPNSCREVAGWENAFREHGWEVLSSDIGVKSTDFEGMDVMNRSLRVKYIVFFTRPIESSAYGFLRSSRINFKKLQSSKYISSNTN